MCLLRRLFLEIRRMVYPLPWSYKRMITTTFTEEEGAGGT
jgi:hypothetical protein